MRSMLAAILALASLPVATPTRAGYAADLAESEWQSVSGAAACHLVHEVPRLGTVVLSQYDNLEFAATVVTRRPPTAEREGRLYGVTPPWKGGGREALQVIQARPGRNSVTLDSATARRILRRLEAGDFVALHFANWGDGPLEAALSPVRFRAALRTHLRCVSGQGAGDKPAARPSGAVSGTAMAGSEAGSGGDAAARLPRMAPVDVYFATASARVDKTDLDAVREVANRLAGGGYWSRIVVSGHADSTGGGAYNRALGLARAVEVRNRLINLGVASDRIEVRTLGEQSPRGDNDTEYGRARNRRVTIEAEH